MQVILAAPAVRRVSELRVRVRHEIEVIAVTDMIMRAGQKLPLEQLIVSPTTRALGHLTHVNASELRKQFPHLWLATRYARLATLLDKGLPDRTTAEELRALAGAPMTRELRVRIGRGLSSAQRLSTTAACELIAGLGASARVFVPALTMLLRPQVSPAAAWILPVLPRFGPWVEELVPLVRSITGSVGRHEAELRSLAGHCVRALDERGFGVSSVGHGDKSAWRPFEAGWVRAASCWGLGIRSRPRSRRR